MAGVRDLSQADINAIADYFSDAIAFQPPAAPLELQGVPGSYSIINLTWKASPTNSSNSLKGYTVFRKDQGDFTQLNVLIPADKTIYSDQNLTENTTYVYRVVSVDNRNNFSTASAEVTVTTPGKPDQPDLMKPILSGDFIATPKNYWSVALSWKPSTDQGGSGLKEYQIFRNQVWIKTVAPNEVSFIDDNKMKKLDSNTTYLYQIQAIDGAGNKSDALNATVKTPAIQRSEAATLVVNSCNGCHTKPGIPPLPRNWTSQALIENFSKSSIMKFLNDTLTTDEINSISYYLSDESDKTLPTTPVLSSTGNTFSSVTLSWTASSDSESGIKKYKLFRGTSLLKDDIPNNATSFIDTTLTEKTNYSYKVIAMNFSDKDSLPSNEVSVTTPAKPQAPDTQAPTVPVLTATANSYKLIHLSWTASTDTGGSGLQKYVLTRTTGTSSTVDFTKDLTATSFDDSSVISNTKYSYQIKAIDNANNSSQFSTKKDVTTLALDPKTLIFGSAGNNGKCTACHTQHPDEPSLRATFRDKSVTTLAILKDKFQNKGGMSFFVKAGDPNKLTDEEINTIFNYLSVIDNTPPSAPTLTATVDSFSQVTLRWSGASDSESGIKKYKLFRGTSLLKDDIPNNATSFIDTTLTEKTNYSYKVIAMNFSDKDSLPSNEVSVTTPAKPQAPDTQAPTVPVLTATANSYKLIHLSWTASTDTGGSGLQKYVLTRTTGTSSTVDFTKDLTATSFDDSSVISNTKYSYQIRAVDGAGNKSALSAAAIATTQDLNVGSVFIGTSPTNPGKCTGCHGHHSTDQALIEKFQSASPQITNANLLKQLGDRYSDMKDTFNGLSAEELNSIFNYLSAAPKPPTPLRPGPVVQSKIMTFNAPEPTANNMFWRIFQIFQQAPRYQDSKGITHYVLQDRTIYKPGVLGGGCSRYDFCSISNASVPSPSWNLVRAGLILNGCSELISHKDFSVSKVLSTAGIVGAAVPTPDSNNIKTVYSHFFPGYSPSKAVVNSLLSISTETGTDKTEAWKNIFLPLCEWSAGGTQ
jgi:fibronectin type 3 domain-containing protein